MSGVYFTLYLLEVHLNDLRFEAKALICAKWDFYLSWPFAGALYQLNTRALGILCRCEYVYLNVNFFYEFRIHDFLLSRLSNEDDLEKNLSTFASEMASSAMILG